MVKLRLVSSLFMLNNPIQGAHLSGNLLIAINNSTPFDVV
jgi:hypothetical protein